MKPIDDNDGPLDDLPEAKKRAKADRKQHAGKPDDPRDKGSEAADLEDPAMQENVEDNT